ncbi:TPA: hypothetical protein ACNB0W_002049 [Escherichia coli]|nr:MULTISPECIES: hypothetical protein [Enterobacteriaceae]MBU0054941.1 hypothetical protein [Escherichia coli]MBU0072256.1 hypothetical protein [Escherichia coli]MBU0152030.1 hypothetical protein [Escherichia coli]MBU0181405.1 hypothetical protein [Escherichia coli]MBU0253596.1 hypothetical protein [Escherichia coli]
MSVFRIHLDGNKKA